MGSVIVAGARTPMGRLLGALKDYPAVELGAVAIKAALERSGVSPDQVQYVVMGHVLQAGTGQITARQAAAKAGVPMTVPAATVNKVCLSGLDSIALADQLIRAGEYDIVVAGGMESMTQAPHLMPRSRTGVKYGDATLIDSMERDGLWDSYHDILMGALTEQANDKYNVSREDQDAYALRSHQRAAIAQKDGGFEAEIVPVGEVTTDEGIRPNSTLEMLAKLRPSFSKDGTITAASSSPISDGACAVVVMSKAKAEELGLTWLAEIGAHATVAGPDSSLQLQPSNAIRAACAKEGIVPAHLDHIEINEAFAMVALTSTRDLGVDEDKVNPQGGAIALGHPLGMSGARVALHAALTLQRHGGGVAAVALCGGGGQGEALVLRVPAA